MSVQTSTGLPVMLTTEEVAGVLRLAEWTVQRKCKGSEFKGAVKVNKRWLIPETTIALMLSGGE
jgi:hypothetical protein